MTVHRVYALPSGGEYTRAKCGYRTRNPKLLAVTDTRPEGGCRNCWRDDEPTNESKPKNIALLTESSELDPETIQAILEGHFYPTNRSPKAA